MRRACEKGRFPGVGKGLKDTVAGLQIAVIGVRRRYLYGNTRHSVLSVTVQVAGPGGGRGGVGE